MSVKKISNSRPKKPIRRYVTPNYTRLTTISSKARGMHTIGNGDSFCVKKYRQKLLKIRIYGNHYIQIIFPNHYIRSYRKYKQRNSIYDNSYKHTSISKYARMQMNYMNIKSKSIKQRSKNNECRN